MHIHTGVRPTMEESNMGTPKKQSAKHNLAPLTPAEQLRLLNKGRQLGTDFKDDEQGLQYIFEELKDLLLPFTEWLDKSLTDLPGFYRFKDDVKLKKKRAISIYDGEGISIALMRSGEWAVRFDSSRPESLSLVSGEVHELNSHDLAIAIKNQADPWVDPTMDRYHPMAEVDHSQMEFVPTLLRHAFVLKIVELAINWVEGAIHDREQRLQVMRQRLGSARNFEVALDPLRMRLNPLQLDQYSIHELHEIGFRNMTAGSYFASAALEPFWKLVDRVVGEPVREEAVDHLSLSSLDYLLERIAYAAHAVYEKATARELFGRTSGRLPFTDEEIAVLREIAKKVYDYQQI